MTQMEANEKSGCTWISAHFEEWTTIGPISIALLGVLVLGCNGPTPPLQISSVHLTDSAGRQRLQEAGWMALIESKAGSQLVMGPPAFASAGSKSPNEGALEVLPPVGTIGKVRFWAKGGDLTPGTIPAGEVVRDKQNFPSRMTGRFQSESLTVSSTQKSDGSFVLKGMWRGQEFQLLSDENPDPSNNGWHLVWIGDLNRDGNVDLVFEVDHYMTQQTHLLLGQRPGGFSVAAIDEEDWD